jgi:hypothetical protein
VGEDEVFEIGEAFVALALVGEFLGAERFVGLQGLDGEGTGDAQLAFDFLRLVVEGFRGGWLTIGDAAERDVRDFLVNEALAQIAAFLIVEFVARLQLLDSKID